MLGGMSMDGNSFPKLRTFKESFHLGNRGERHPHCFEVTQCGNECFIAFLFLPLPNLAYCALKRQAARRKMSEKQPKGLASTAD